MSVFALIILGKVVWSYLHGVPPEAITMGIIGVMALVANIISAVVLFAFREGDANMQSVWLCSRNDAIGNIAVMIAALGVFGTQSVLPDLIVALLMAGLGLSAGWSIIKSHSENAVSNSKISYRTRIKPLLTFNQFVSESSGRYNLQYRPLIHRLQTDTDPRPIYEP